jgi:CBS domain containing-hemolysin-like protein
VTVSGYVIHLLGRVPERGTSLHVGQWQGIIEAVDGIKIKSLRLRKTVGDIPAEDRTR